MSKDDSTSFVASNVKVDAKKKRVVIERNLASSFTTYHVNWDLSSVPQGMSTEQSNDEVVPVYISLRDHNAGVNPYAQSIIHQILNIPGVLPVDGVVVTIFAIVVWKGVAFDDGDIDPAVIAVIAAMYNLTVDELELTEKINPGTPVPIMTPLGHAIST